MEVECAETGLVPADGSREGMYIPVMAYSLIRPIGVKPVWLRLRFTLSLTSSRNDLIAGNRLLLPGRLDYATPTILKQAPGGKFARLLALVKLVHRRWFMM